MKRHRAATAILASLLSATVMAQLAEFGIEGMGVVSTPAGEVRATVSPDGQRIVWGSTDRPGGAGGWDLWQARLEGKRWVEPQPLAINSADKDFDPFFSADGRWLYFFSNRPGGQGGDDLWRAAVKADSGWGEPENLGAGVNTRGDEWAPATSADGQRLLFASNGHGGAGRHDLFVARWDGRAFVDPTPAPGINTAADEFDAAWLEDGRAILFARSTDVEAKPIQLLLAQCEGQRYGAATPWALSFNTADAATLGPVVDWSRPREVLVTGAARSPRAGKLDIYRALAPRVTGTSGCR